MPKGLGVKGFDVKGLASGLVLLGCGHLDTPKEPALIPQLYPYTMPTSNTALYQGLPTPEAKSNRSPEQYQNKDSGLKT